MATPTVGVPDYARSVGVIDANQVLFNGNLVKPGVANTPIFSVQRWQSITISSSGATGFGYNIEVVWWLDAAGTIALGTKVIGCSGGSLPDAVLVTLQNRGPFVQIFVLNSTISFTCPIVVIASNRVGDHWSFTVAPSPTAGAGIISLPYQLLPNGATISQDGVEVVEGSGQLTVIGTVQNTLAQVSFWDQSGLLASVDVGADPSKTYISVPIEILPYHIRLSTANLSGAGIAVGATLTYNSKN